MVKDTTFDGVNDFFNASTIVSSIFLFAYIYKKLFKQKEPEQIIIETEYIPQRKIMVSEYCGQEYLGATSYQDLININNSVISKFEGEKKLW